METNKTLNDLFVIIVTYNGMQWLHKCLASVKDYSTIVVDNGSIDGSPEFIKISYPEVQVIEQAENIGFGAANNIGIRMAYDAGAHYVFLLNQDAWVEPDTINGLVDAAANNCEYGILSPIHFNGRGDALDFNFSTFISGERCNGLISDYFTGNKLNEVYPIEFVNAAAWLLTRECIERVGGFSPSFFHYAEDQNYVERVKYHQLKVGIVPSVKIYHDRENRKSNPFLAEESLSFERLLIKELSRPTKKKSLAYFYTVALKKFFSSLFPFDPKKSAIALKNFSSIYKLRFRSLERNRRLTLKEDLTFLK